MANVGLKVVEVPQPAARRGSPLNGSSGWHSGHIPDYGNFHGVLPNLKTLKGILSGVLALQGRAPIQPGVLLMIATPVMRVAFAIFAFALERDWLYTGVSCVVLAVLGYALLS